VAAVTVPLFPLGTVLFPGSLLPLHIFEPRYRRLVRELLDRTDGPREFGVVAIRAGREVGGHGVQSLYRVGCTAELRQVRTYSDGRFDIMARGARRFRIVDLYPEVEDAAARGDVELLPESPSARSPELADRATALFDRYRRAVLDAQGVTGDEPFSLPADPVGCYYAIAAAMILDLTDRQHLLEAATVDDRLSLAIELLRRETTMVDRLSLRAGEELSRGPYSAN